MFERRGSTDMTRRPTWLIGIACVGVVATLVAACLLWFVVVHPVAVAEALSRGF
jgi:hypothetical protein